MLRRRTLALLGMLALALVSCGDGKTDVSTGTTVSTSSTVEPSTTTGPSTTLAEATSTTGEAGSGGGDKAKAEGLLLTEADAPSGFTSSPHETSAVQDVAGTKLAACAGLPDPEKVNVIDVHGPDLRAGEFDIATSQVTVVKTVEDAKAEVRAIKAPKFRDCLRDQLTQSLREQYGDTAVRKATVESIPVASFGEDTNGTRVEMKLEVAGSAFSSFQDSFLLVKGRYEVTVTFVSFQKPFDAAIERALVAKVGARLDALKS